MSSVARCRRCGQQLAVYEGDRYCPNCTTFSPNARRCFAEWLAMVNEVLVRKVGVASADLPGIAYASLFADGFSPEEAADEAITNSLE